MVAKTYRVRGGVPSPRMDVAIKGPIAAPINRAELRNPIAVPLLSDFPPKRFGGIPARIARSTICRSRNW